MLQSRYILFAIDRYLLVVVGLVVARYAFHYFINFLKYNIPYKNIIL